MAGQPIFREYQCRVDAAGADSLYERIGNGETVTAIAGSIGVSRTYLSTFLNKDKDRLADAHRHKAGYHADRLNEIADECNPTNANAQRVRADIHRWIASRLDREVYGEQKQPSVSVNLATLHLDALRQFRSDRQASNTTIIAAHPEGGQ